MHARTPSAPLTTSPPHTHTQWVYITCLHEGIPPAPPQLISPETLHFQRMRVLSFFFLFLRAVWPHLKARALHKNNFLHDGLDFTMRHRLSLFSASKRTRGQCVLQLLEVIAVNMFFLSIYAPCTNANFYPIKWFCVSFASYIPFYTYYIALMLF